MSRLITALADRYRIERELGAGGLDGTQGKDADKASWSAKGTELVFHGHDARDRAGIFSIPAAGGTSRLLALFEDPRVSAVPGNRSFAGGQMYYSAEEGQSNVWVMELGRP